MTTETILSRIKKLQSLAGNNPSEAEATAAAAKVQELLREHNLSMVDVESHDEPVTRETYGKTEYVIPNANKLTMTWKSMLLHGLAKYNFCSTVRHPGTTRVSIIGKPSNVAAVCYIHEVLVEQIERLSTQAVRQVFDHKSIYKREFCQGAASRILSRLREEQEQAQAASSHCNAIMVVTGRELQQAVSSFFPRLRPSYTTIGNRTNGYADGRAAGADISLVHGGINAGVQRANRLLN